MSKKDWGNISWILMHSLAEKVTENNFNTCKKNLIKIIFDLGLNILFSNLVLIMYHLWLASRYLNFFSLHYT